MDKMEKIHEILELVLEINGMEQRKRDITGKKPTIFLEYSGHTNGLNVHIHRNGWYAGSCADIDYTVYLESDELDELIEQLQDFKEEVGNVL